MKKLFVEANFNSKLERSITFSLLSALKKIAPAYEITLVGRDYLQDVPEGIEFKQTKLPRAVAFTFANCDAFYFPHSNIPAILSQRTMPVCFITDISPIEFELENSPELKKYKRKIRTAFYRSGQVFVPTENIRQEIQNKLAEELSLGSVPDVLGIASVIDEKYLELPLAINNERYFYTQVDDLAYNDGLNELLKAFIYMHTTGRNKTRLYISGLLKAPSSEIAINIEVARKLGIIREYEDLSDAQRAVMLRGAIAALLPSKKQTLPIAHLDAMKCSCPVVTFDSPAIREICDDSVIYAALEDTENYKNILSVLEKDEEYRKAYIYKGLYREKNFSWENCAGTFVEKLELAFEAE